MSTLHGQRSWTGLGSRHGNVARPSWASHPSGDLPEPPSLRDPAFRGAVTGRKYHCRQFRLWRTVYHWPFLDGSFSLGTFDVIVFYRFSGNLQVVLAYPPCRFPFSSGTANVSMLLDMTAPGAVFFKEHQRRNDTLLLTSTLAERLDNQKNKFF